MDKKETNRANDSARQGAVSDERAASMPAYGRGRCRFRPDAFVDRGIDDESQFEPMIGNRFLERRKPLLD